MQHEVMHPDMALVHRMLKARADRTIEQDWNIVGGSRAVAEVLDRWRVCPGVYAVPFLSPLVCDWITEWATSKVAEYAPNDEEDLAYQIDELVLEQAHPGLFDDLRALAHEIMFPVLQLIHGRVPEKCVSIQLAHYNPKGVAHGNWHHDNDSDQTMVVSLAPELFTGGGTDIMLDPARNRWVTIPPLEKGYALVFNGKMTLHRGRHVHSGDRHLLVFWTEVKP